MSEAISASRYWVLRGSFFGGPSVAWGTQAVLHQGGPIAGRIVGDPSSFAIGLPSAIGAAPERTALTVELDNADGSLDVYLVGSTLTASEYAGPSVLGFEGRLYRGTIAADGTCTEEAFTPMLAASGAVDVDRAKGSVSIALAHVDRTMLGPIQSLFSVREVTQSSALDVQCAYPELLAKLDGDAIWALYGLAEGENLDATVPWLYGPCSVPLVRVTPSGHYPAAYIAGMAWEKPSSSELVDPTAKIIAKLRSDYPESRETLSDPLPVIVRTEVAVEGGSREVWLALAVQHAKPTEEPEKYWWSSTHPNGIPGFYDPSSPARVLREIITDHAEAGAACLHGPSWAAVEARQAGPMRSACAGAIEAATTISDLIAHIAPIGGMGLWVGVDGMLHVAMGGWTSEDKAAAALSLPELIEPDIYPGDDSGAATWSESIPADPEDRGAALSKVTVQWTAEQRELFPIATSGGQAPRRLPLPIDSEWEPEGAWINPRAAGPIVRAMASRGVYPTRRVRFPTHADLALLEPGALLRVSHPWGVTAEPPYQRRLVRLERAEVQPGEHAAALTAEDLGPSEKIRLGLLDSIGQWLAVDPSKPKAATLTIETSGKATSTEGIFTDLMVGATIWAHGAALPENRRSYRITKWIDAKTVNVDSPPSALETIPSASVAQLVDAPWLVMWTHESKGASFRPDYIRGAQLPGGALVGGATGYQFEGG